MQSSLQERVCPTSLMCAGVLLPKRLSQREWHVQEVTELSEESAAHLSAILLGHNRATFTELSLDRNKEEENFIWNSFMREKKPLAH